MKKLRLETVLIMALKEEHTCKIKNDYVYDALLLFIKLTGISAMKCFTVASVTIKSRGKSFTVLRTSCNIAKYLGILFYNKRWNYVFPLEWLVNVYLLGSWN